MAIGKIKSTDLIEAGAIQSIITDAANLETQLKAILTVNAQILENNPFKTAKDVEQFEAATNSVTSATKALNDVQKLQVEQKKKLTELTDEELKQNLQAQMDAKERKARLTEEIKLTQENLGTLEKLTLQNAKLTKERKTLNLETEKGRKRLQEINKELDKNNKFIKENSDKLTQQRLNVGNYTESIIKAFDSTGVLQKATVALAGAKDKLASGLGGVTKASMLTSKAMYAIPIFMLIGAITQLVAWFTRTQEGAEALERVFAAVSTTINVFVDRLSKGGGAIMDFVKGKKSWSEMNEVLKESMTGVIDEIVSEVKAVDDLTVAYQNLERAKVAGIVSEKKMELEIAKLRRDARDEEMFNVQQRRKFAKEAAKLEADLFDIQIARAQEEARIAAEKSKISVDLIKDDRAREEAAAKVIELQAAKADAERSALKELNKLRKEEQAKRKEYESEQIRLIEASKKADNERTAAFIKNSEERQKELDSAKKKELDALKLQAQARETEWEKQQTIYEMEKDELAKLAALKAETAKKSTEILMKQISIQQQFTKQQTNDQIKLTQDRISRESQLAAMGMENRLAEQEAAAAKLEAQRIRQERRQMQAQKALAYLETFRGFLKDGDNPGSATAKTSIIMAAIASSLGGFFEGTESLGEKDKAKPFFNTGKDDYLIRAHKGERIIPTAMNKHLKPYNNEEVVDIVNAHKRGSNYVSTLSDPRIIDELKNVQKSISNIELAIDWDAYDRRIERKIERGTKTIIKTATQRPRL